MRSRSRPKKRKGIGLRTLCLCTVCAGLVVFAVGFVNFAVRTGPGSIEIKVNTRGTRGGAVAAAAAAAASTQKAPLPEAARKQAASWSGEAQDPLPEAGSPAPHRPEEHRGLLKPQVRPTDPAPKLARRELAPHAPPPSEPEPAQTEPAGAGTDGAAAGDLNPLRPAVAQWRPDGLAAAAKYAIPGSGIAFNLPSAWPSDDLPPGAAALSAAEIARQRNIHLVFSTGCEVQHDWQSVGVFYTARKHMPFANITRLVSCYHPTNKDEVMTVFDPERMQEVPDKLGRTNPRPNGMKLDSSGISDETNDAKVRARASARERCERASARAEQSPPRPATARPVLCAAPSSSHAAAGRGLLVAGC
jgi:hypothetical protein